MANISISDLYSSDANSLLTGIDDKEGDLIKSAVNRALDARGGLSDPRSTLGRPPFPIGTIAQPPVIETYLA
jgi:hypothetical protein